MPASPGWLVESRKCSPRPGGSRGQARILRSMASVAPVFVVVLAFNFMGDGLRDLRFEKLSAIIDGPLDGTLNFKILFDGRSDIPVKTGKETQRVDSPVKYRITINAPLLSLIEQAVLSTNVKLQIERAQKAEEAGPAKQ